MKISQRGRFTIEESPAKPVPLESHPHIFKASSVITWSVWLLYFSRECAFVRLIQRDASGILWTVWIALFAEVCLSFQELVLAFNILLALFTPRRQDARPSYRLLGQSAPPVDVLVTCCGEPFDIILDTVKAALSQDYPSNCFRVFVLDDKHDDKLRQEINELNQWLADKRLARVMYCSRNVKTGDKSFFKAGNLNFGINETRRLGSSNFVAGLDADMIPEPQWLRKMVPHMILDESVGMAIGPQRYYNVPPKDPLGQQADFSMYFTVQEILNDSLGSSMCTGTGYVVRRKALEAIGGWPLAESGEDFMCSALLGNAGWGVAFVRENLQYGLCPDSLRALIKQRMRWTDAGIEVHRQFGFYLRRSDISAQMTLAQRAVNLLYAFRDYAPVTDILALLVIPLALLPLRKSEHSNVYLDYQHPLRTMQYLYFAAFVANKAYYFIAYNHIGMSRVWNFQSNEIWAAPYMTYRCLASLLPSAINIPTFVVCGTIPANERSRIHRKPLLARVLTFDMLMYVFYIIYASVPLLATWYYGKRASIIPFPGPWVKLVSCLLKTTVPVRYLLWPPEMPEREKLMVEDERGVNVPKWQWKDGGSGEWVEWALVGAVEFSVLAWILWWSGV